MDRRRDALSFPIYLVISITVNWMDKTKDIEIDFYLAFTDQPVSTFL